MHIQRTQAHSEIQYLQRHGLALYTLFAVACSVTIFSLALFVSFSSTAFASTCPSLPPLNLGARGESVTFLQQFLTDYGYYTGLVGGYYGPLTQAAVQQFQCQNNITCSGSPVETGFGVVGPQTRAAIRALCDISAPTPSPTQPQSVADLQALIASLLAQVQELQARLDALRRTPTPTPCAFNGSVVAHDSTVTAYVAASVPVGSTCESQTRTCTNGTLSGTYTHAACTVAGTPTTYTWHTGTWSTCTNNSQTRTVQCKNNAGTVVAESFCTTSKPATTQSCTACTNPAPQVVTNTCQEVGYPAGYTGSYTSTRQFDCHTNTHSAWTRHDTCQAPVVTEVFDFSADNNSIDFRKYFPSTYTSILSRKPDGSIYSDFRFYPTTPTTKLIGTNINVLDFYNKYFSIGKPGTVYLWEKRYGETRTTTPTIEFEFLGEDKSVTEVGGFFAPNSWRPDIAFGYSQTRPEKKPTGLNWSSPGGLRTNHSDPQNPFPTRSFIDDIYTARQNASLTDVYAVSEAKAWNDTVILETFATYTPPYGRSATGVWGEGNGREYKNVIRLILYHGTRLPGHTDFSCASNVKPEYASLYRSYPGYHTYASEFYWAEDKGIIQETFLYTEDGTYWNQPNCEMGTIFKNDKNPLGLTTSYIDEGNLQCTMPEPTITTRSCSQAGYGSGYIGEVSTYTQLDCYTGKTYTRTLDICAPAICVNPPPQVVTNTCQEVGYPAGYTGSYTSTRQLDCKTGQYSDWIRSDTCRAPHN